MKIQLSKAKLITKFIVVVVIVVIILVWKEELRDGGVEPRRHLEHERHDVHLQMLFDGDATDRSFELTEDSQRRLAVKTLTSTCLWCQHIHLTAV